MRIALLNLQYDNNYGGNLQRYALMAVLERMGHDVTHLNLRFNYNNASLYKKIKRFPMRLFRKIFKDRTIVLFPEYHRQKAYEIQCSITDLFYNRYIRHTKILGSKKDLSNHQDYDLYIVGSDQVWRKTIVSVYGIDTFFFDYIPDTCRRIAYGASFGVSENELEESDIERLAPLYKKFSAVSVREPSGLQLLQSYGWNSPKAEWVLDPTLLLSKNDYERLIAKSVTSKFDGKIFCYILDTSDEKTKIIKEEAKRYNVPSPFIMGLSCTVTIEQWLRYFADAEFVITDSYHGLVFSIIFNKPFRLLRNKTRGNARFDAIFEACALKSDDGAGVDWDRVNKQLDILRTRSWEWLKNSLRD